MEAIATILTSPNALLVILGLIVILCLLAFFSSKGLIAFKGHGVQVGKSEPEVRSLLIKQKEFVLEYCGSKVQIVLADMNKQNRGISYVNTSYVFEKMVDQVLAWLLVNNISSDKLYIDAKIDEAKLVVFKAVGNVNNELLKDENVVGYLNKICEDFTKDIINGLLRIKQIEGF